MNTYICYKCGELFILDKSNNSKKIDCPNCEEEVILDEKNKKNAEHFIPEMQEIILRIEKK